jgi:ubiquinone/menaquinone biosynthesis C-methylase UbiE
MSNKNVSFFSPDKLIKDFQWDDLVKASKFAKGKLLDIGCGTMPYKSIFISKVTKYIGIDKNNSAADIKGDFLNIKLLDNSFNTILCTQVLEHTYDPIQFLEKIHTILKKNGILILTVPFMGSLHETPNDYYRYTEYALKYLLKQAKFQIIYIHGQGNWISAIGQEYIFYLESTFNRFLLKYPKRVLQLAVQLIVRAFSQLPSRYTKPDRCPINYIVVARKK